MTPPKTLEEWIKEMPDGYQFAFICITKQLNENQIQLLCKGGTNGDFNSIMADFDHCKKALRKSEEKFLEDCFSEFIEEQED